MVRREDDRVNIEDFPITNSEMLQAIEWAIVQYNNQHDGRSYNLRDVTLYALIEAGITIEKASIN